jgi:hypothetical protein
VFSFVDSAECPGVKRAGDHPREDLRQRVQLERQLIARLRTATLRFSDAQTERIWVIVSAHQAGLSIRNIAGAVRRRIICESFSAIYEWWRISLCSTIVCCRGLRPKTTVC